VQPRRVALASIVAAQCEILMTAALMDRSYRGEYRRRFLEGLAADVDVVFVDRLGVMPD
jgi:hypothetical protein